MIWKYAIEYIGSRRKFWLQHTCIIAFVNKWQMLTVSLRGLSESYMLRGFLHLEAMAHRTVLLTKNLELCLFWAICLLSDRYVKACDKPSRLERSNLVLLLFFVGVLFKVHGLAFYSYFQRARSIQELVYIESIRYFFKVFVFSFLLKTCFIHKDVL